MKRLLQTLSALFIILNGFVALYIGYQLLRTRGLFGIFASFIFPGSIFFIIAGLLSTLIPFFTFKKMRMLNFIALEEGVGIVFILADEVTLFHRLTPGETLTAGLGIYLIVTSIILLLWDNGKAHSTKL